MYSQLLVLLTVVGLASSPNPRYLATVLSVLFNQNPPANFIIQGSPHHGPYVGILAPTAVVTPLILPTTAHKHTVLPVCDGFSTYVTCTSLAIT